MNQFSLRQRTHTRQRAQTVKDGARLIPGPFGRFGAIVYEFEDALGCGSILAFIQQPRRSVADPTIITLQERD